LQIWKINNLATANYTGALAEGAKTAPAGGWAQNNWSPKGTLVGEGPAGAYQPVAKGGRGRGTATATQAASTSRPSLQAGGSDGGWAPGAAAKDPWSRGGGESPLGRGGSDKNNGDEDLKSSRPYGGGSMGDRGSRGGRNEEEDAEERKRFRSGIPSRRNIQASKEHQAVKRTEGETSGPITARIVASWKAPVGGGKPGRRYTASASRYIPPHVLRVRPWVGSRKRSIQEVVEEIPASRPTAEQIDTYIKAQEEGKSCCTNAAWFD
jgi:hypothetical protein